MSSTACGSNRRPKWLPCHATIHKIHNPVLAKLTRLKSLLPGKQSQYFPCTHRTAFHAAIPSGWEGLKVSLQASPGTISYQLSWSLFMPNYELRSYSIHYGQNMDCQSPKSVNVQYQITLDKGISCTIDIKVLVVHRHMLQQKHCKDDCFWLWHLMGSISEVLPIASAKQYMLTPPSVFKSCFSRSLALSCTCYPLRGPA